MATVKALALASGCAALALGACTHAVEPATPQEPIGTQLGYPVFVRVDDGACHYQVQDMIFIQDRDLKGWMDQLADKTRQVDIVVEGAGSTRCERRAQTIVSEAGFAKVVVRSSAVVD